MDDEQKQTPAAKPASARKPPRKLIPRPAPKPAVVAPENAVPLDEAEAKTAETAPTPAAEPAAKPARVRKPSREDETVARHHQSLIEALAMAQAIKYDQPKVMRQPPATDKKAGKAGKAEKPPKAKKIKLVRNNYAMPEAEYARIAEVKKRLVGMDVELKKSEILRAGLAVLAALNDAELKAVSARVEKIKTGRPRK